MNKFHFSLPSTQASRLEAIEARFGVQLPGDYKEFILKYNGGSPDYPIFNCHFNKSNKVEECCLLFILGITDDHLPSSATFINQGFHENDEEMRGFWVFGVCDRGHLIFNCRDNNIAVCDLNATYGVPQGGFSNIILKPFSGLIDSLAADRKRKWVPQNWSED